MLNVLKGKPYVGLYKADFLTLCAGGPEARAKLPVIIKYPVRKERWEWFTKCRKEHPELFKNCRVEADAIKNCKKLTKIYGDYFYHYEFSYL